MILPFHVKLKESKRYFLKVEPKERISQAHLPESLLKHERLNISQGISVLEWEEVNKAKSKCLKQIILNCKTCHKSSCKHKFKRKIFYVLKPARRISWRHRRWKSYPRVRMKAEDNRRVTQACWRISSENHLKYKIHWKMPKTWKTKYTWTTSKIR